VSDPVREFLEEELPDLELSDDTDLLQPGLLDSLGIVRLVAVLEDEEDIAIDQDEIRPERFRTMKAIRAFVAEKKS